MQLRRTGAGSSRAGRERRCGVTSPVLWREDPGGDPSPGTGALGACRHPWQPQAVQVFTPALPSKSTFMPA